MVTITAGLLDTLKTKNPAAYNWFISRGIDLHNLSKYTSGIALAISLAVGQPVIEPQVDTNLNIKASITPISPSELRGKSEVERANLVWTRYGYLIRQAADTYDIEPNLIFATIMVESGGDTRAIRHEPRINDASYGLGQLLYGTARGIGYRGTPEGLFDPATNIDLIAKYHKRNFDHYKELDATELTIAYNTGSPRKTPHPGHLNKFHKWYHSLANLEVDLS